MEAFVLALCLRMVRSTMADRDAQPEEPDAQLGVRRFAGAPRRTVVAEDAIGQTEASEDRDEALGHRVSPLVFASEQADGVARVIVEDGQRMAAARVQGEVTFKVDLPERVGFGMLEALKVAWLTSPLAEPAMSTQDGGDGARRGHMAMPERLQSSAEFATTPSGMLLAKLKNGGLDLGGGFSWRGMGNTRAVVQVVDVAGSVAVEPLVGGGATDAEATTKLGEIGSLDGGETDKLVSLGHGG